MKMRLVDLAWLVFHFRYSIRATSQICNATMWQHVASRQAASGKQNRQSANKRTPAAVATPTPNTNQHQRKYCQLKPLLVIKLHLKPNNRTTKPNQTKSTPLKHPLISRQHVRRVRCGSACWTQISCITSAFKMLECTKESKESKAFDGTPVASATSKATAHWNNFTSY